MSTVSARTFTTAPGYDAGSRATTAGNEAGSSDANFAAMVGRLSKLSVEKHFDAYADIDWDNPSWALKAGDLRLMLPPFEPITDSQWYTQLPDAERATFGLYRYAACMKTGWHFENLLQRGLLAFAFRQRNGSDAFRYVHHEIIEESQHTLMFQEYVNRSGLPVWGMAWRYRLLAEAIVEPIAKLDPALFFVFVLGGEEPADHLQKRLLRDGVSHPLLERVMRIHITEEARHLSFARHFLRREVPRMGLIRRMVMSLAAPIVLGRMARIMIYPPSDLKRYVGIPRHVTRDAQHSEKGRQLLKDSVAAARALWLELGLVGPVSRVLWRANGIWDTDGATGEEFPARANGNTST